MAVTTSDKPHTRKIELSDLRDSARASSPPCSVPHPKPSSNPPASHEISAVKTSDLNRHSTNAVFRTSSYNNHEPSVFRNQTEFGFLWLLAPDSADTVLHSQDFSHLGFDFLYCLAPVAELADAHDSGSCVRNGRGGSTPLRGISKARSSDCVFFVRDYKTRVILPERLLFVLCCRKFTYLRSQRCGHQLRPVFIEFYQVLLIS